MSDTASLRFKTPPFEKPREIAARVLLAHERSRQYVEETFDQTLQTRQLSPADRRLARELVFGVLRWQATLDWLIQRKAKAPALKAGLRAFLRLGLYQLFWLDRVPPHAAIYETVEAGKRLGFGPQSGFLNAVLRDYQRNQTSTQILLEQLKVSEPPIGFSHPEWLIQRWSARWDRRVVEQLLEWNNKPAPIYGRINRLKWNSEQFSARIAAEKVTIQFVDKDWFDAGSVFELRSFPSLSTLPLLADGGFYIQDPSTLLAVQLLDPQPGEAILDLCAAPGGKTAFIAERMKNRGRILACDSEPARLEILRQNCARLGIQCAEIELRGPQSLPAAELFDRALVDAPCSNTGVMRRRADLRWRLRSGDLERFVTTQIGLLREAAKAVKEGGVLVYSTCSLEPEENAGVIGNFLASHSGWRLDAERQLTPFAEGVDGAYAARLRRAAR